jgi:hypothetical protein
VHFSPMISICPGQLSLPNLVAAKVFGEECHSCAFSCREFRVISAGLFFFFLPKYFPHPVLEDPPL